MKINKYINPFSKAYKKEVKDYRKLNENHKRRAVIYSIAAGLFTLPFLGIGGFATFRYFVNKYKVTDITGKDKGGSVAKADKAAEKLTDQEAEENTKSEAKERLETEAEAKKKAEETITAKKAKAEAKRKAVDTIKFWKAIKREKPDLVYPTNLDDDDVVSIAKQFSSWMANNVTEIGDITSIYLDSNIVDDDKKLTSLPPEICMLTGLKNLFLRGNLFTELPKEMGNLKNLIFLDLSNCSQLKSLTEEFCNLSKLSSLNLSNCPQLGTLPIKIGKLLNLHWLNLSNNKNLTELPEEFGNLKNLKNLNLGNSPNLNEFKQIFQLINLLTLDLNDCPNLTEITAEIENLSKLNFLRLSNNPRLAELPNEILKLEKFKFLYIYKTSIGDSEEHREIIEKLKKNGVSVIVEEI